MVPLGYYDSIFLFLKQNRFSVQYVESLSVYIVINEIFYVAQKEFFTPKIFP